MSKVDSRDKGQFINNSDVKDSVIEASGVDNKDVWSLLYRTCVPAKGNELHLPLRRVILAFDRSSE